MKIELHCHTGLKSVCAWDKPDTLMPRFIQCGYDAVYLTEHDAVWTEDEIARLQDQWPAIRICPGIERSLSNLAPRQHLLILGTSDASYLGITDERALVERARSEGLLTVLAHPFRWGGGDAMLGAGIVPDAIEGRSFNHSAEQDRKSRDASAHYGMKVVNAADVHAVKFVNHFWIETTRDVTDARDIRNVILNGAYANHVLEPNA